MSSICAFLRAEIDFLFRLKHFQSSSDIITDFKTFESFNSKKRLIEISYQLIIGSELIVCMSSKTFVQFFIEDFLEFMLNPMKE